MGIKLDWEIEAEQSHVRSEGEDKETARQRRIARLRFMIFVLVVVGILGGAAAVVVLRLREVDMQIEQLLRDTIDAEVAALRIGDRAAFLGVQRSATEDWLRTQDGEFDLYQQLKVEQDVQLTGRVVDIDVDETRARASVEEIIGGVPYQRVWFYWRYDDGWRHVPPDYTFWGDAQTMTREGVTVNYRSVDAPLAQAVADTVSRWLTQGCAALRCATVPQIEIQISPGEQTHVDWSAANPWLLQMPSPFVSRARSDMPFDASLQAQTATLLTDRLVGQVSSGMQPAFPADAYFLREEAVRWLSSRFTGIAAEAHLMDSLVQNGGEDAVGRLLQALQPTSDISVLNTVMGTATLDQLQVDWRSFVEWRLTTEANLITARDDANFLSLYDTGDQNAYNLAVTRFSANAPGEPFDVLAVLPQVDANGVPHLHAGVQYANREEEVIFRLVNGVWRRAN